MQLLVVNYQLLPEVFLVTLNGANGTFSGVLSAATGSFTGAVTATSLTLSGCKIDYNTDIENKPDIPSDMTLYIKTDGTVGTLTEEVQNIPTGAKGFKVSSDGLLQASNAIIYGTIFANQGTIGGFNITTRLDNSDHAYENTLYVQTTDGSGIHINLESEEIHLITIRPVLHSMLERKQAV